jgi:hypothetical protein
LPPIVGRAVLAKPGCALVGRTGASTCGARDSTVYASAVLVESVVRIHRAVAVVTNDGARLAPVVDVKVVAGHGGEAVATLAMACGTLPELVQTLDVGTAAVAFHVTVGATPTRIEVRARPGIYTTRAFTAVRAMLARLDRYLASPTMDRAIGTASVRVCGARRFTVRARLER